MSPHYVQKRRKDGSVNRIGYYRCTKTMKFNNSFCHIKQLNADRAEATIIDSLCHIGQNEAALDATIQELNRDLKGKVEPLERDAAQIKQCLAELDGEIDRFVQALGKGKISVDRLEKEMEQRETDKKALLVRYEDLQRKINEEAAYDYNAGIVKQNLQEFRNVVESLTPEEKIQALQCMVKQITVLPDKLLLDVYELADFKKGSSNRSNWLQRKDSNLQHHG